MSKISFYSKLNYKFHEVFRSILSKYFKQYVANKDFTIISNDCWGAEVYKILNRPFNTPFIGLMLMAPCYIKLLEDLKYNFSLPLKAIEKSKYNDIELLKNERDFPIANLGDTGIEIQFLHYSDFEAANSAWKRRIKRINWENLYVKFDCGKDYAEGLSIKRFLKLEFKDKLVFGNKDFGYEEVVLTTQYDSNAVRQFRNSLLYLDPFAWISGKGSKVKFKNRVFLRLLYKFG